LSAHNREATGRPSGTGFAPCHHGELLQGIFRSPTGATRHGLVTLPLHGLGTRARFAGRPGSSHRRVTVEPSGRHKAMRAVELALVECARRGAETCGGHLALTSDVPVGLGMGSSTSDVIAAIRAVTASFAVAIPPTRLAEIAVEAEHASDPVMLEDRPMLFAQREGRVLEILGDMLPTTLVVGCTTGDGRPVDTLALPAALYLDRHVDQYERLRQNLRHAIRTSDVALLGSASTESARCNQRVHAKAELPILEEVARIVGAAGIQVAHSGNVAGILFDPRLPGLRTRVRQCMRALESEGMPGGRTFLVGRATPSQQAPLRHDCVPRKARNTTDRRHRRVGTEIR
jgi:uncharacterized protein involved in propanediol utilization